MDVVQHELKTLERENKNLKGALNQAKLRETNLNSTLNNITKVNKELNSISNSINERLNNNPVNSKENDMLSGVSRDSLSRSQPSQHKMPNTTEHSLSKGIKYKHTQPLPTKWLNYTSIPDIDKKSKILNTSYSRDEYNMMDQYIDDSHSNNINSNIIHKDMSKYSKDNNNKID